MSYPTALVVLVGRPGELADLHAVLEAAGYPIQRGKLRRASVFKALDRSICLLWFDVENVASRQQVIEHVETARLALNDIRDTMVRFEEAAILNELEQREMSSFLDDG